MNQSQKPRPIDETIQKTTQALKSRFVLASKTEIKAWKALIIIMFAAGFFAALVWSAYNQWYVGSSAKTENKVRSETDSQLAKKFRDFPMHGSSGIIGSKFGEDDQDIVNDSAKLKKAIEIHKKYDINVIQIRFIKLTDKCKADDCKLSANGKKFLEQLANSGIKLQMNFNLGDDFKRENEDKFKEDLSKIQSFLGDLNEFRNSNKKAYQNIISFFIGDDIGSARKENEINLAKYIRGKIYSKAGILGRPLDIPLSLDTGTKAKVGADLLPYAEIVAGYRYPLLTNWSLTSFLNRYIKISGVSPDFTFTWVQSHSQFAYNAFWEDDERKIIEHPFPEGIQTASLIFNSLRSGVNHFMLYNDKYMESESMSTDRLAEVGLVNKLIDIIWEPILKDSVPSSKIAIFSDQESRFIGDVFNFRDSNRKNAALLVINTGLRQNHISGKAWATDVNFKNFRDKEQKRRHLSLQDLGFNSGQKNLQAYQIQFPQIQDVKMTLSGDKVEFTVPQINENSIILLTTDKNMAERINTRLKNNSSDAKKLACEAYNARASKTQDEFDKIAKAGGKIPKEYVSLMNQLRENAKDSSCSKMGYREIRTNISRIGDFQVDVYNFFRGIENPKNARKPYPDFTDFNTAYWQNPDGYADFVKEKLKNCEAQRLNFYFLDRYIKDNCVSKEEIVKINSISQNDIESEPSSEESGDENTEATR